MNEQEIFELMKLVSSISESTWASAMARVHALVFQYAIWAGFFFVLGAVLTSVSVYRFKKYYSDDEPAWFFCFLATLTLILCTCWVVASVNRAVAPEWYALQQILLYVR